MLENAVADMAKIAGQKPLVTKTRVSVASFKIRDGWPIGAKVTLRRAKMYEFLDRLVNISLPRVRDFRGVSGRSFDGRGNYNMGVKEQIIFPEIDFDAVDAIRGMDIAITTTAKTDAGRRPAGSVPPVPVQLTAEGRQTMAKTSMINREAKRAKLAKQHAAKREALKNDRQPRRLPRRRWRRPSCRSCRAIPRPAARPAVAP